MVVVTRRPFGVVPAAAIPALRAAFDLPPPRVLVSEVIDSVAARMRLDRAAIVADRGRRPYVRARAAAAWAATRVTRSPRTVIARQLGTFPDYIADIVRRAERLRRVDRPFAELTDAVVGEFAWRVL